MKREVSERVKLELYIKSNQNTGRNSPNTDNRYSSINMTNYGEKFINGLKNRNSII